MNYRLPHRPLTQEEIDRVKVFLEEEWNKLDAKTLNDIAVMEGSFNSFTDLREAILNMRASKEIESSQWLMEFVGFFLYYQGKIMG